MSDKKELTQEQRIEMFRKVAKEALRLTDIKKTQTKKYTVYNKEMLRQFLKNPLSEKNQQGLRDVSLFLYNLSFQYKRLLAYYASQIDLSVYNIIPNASIVLENDEERMLYNYEHTAMWLDKMNLDKTLYPTFITAWREDVFYGYIYYDDVRKNDKNSFTIMPLDMKYCKISSMNYDGTLNFAFDFSFFEGQNEMFLDFWDKEFRKKYDKYQKNTALRWQELDRDKTVCWKINIDQLDRIIPPFAPLFEDLIDLLDLRGLNNVKENLDIYKLLVAKIETISGTKEPNDFAVDLNTAVEFYNKMMEILPPEIGCVLSPMDIEPVTFNKNATDDTDSVAKSMKNLWASAGVSQVLDSNRLTGATAVRAALIADGLMATKPLLMQVEARVNRFLDYVLPNNNMRVKYIVGVTPFNKDEKLAQVKEAATLGLPVKTLYASLVGLSPSDLNAMSYFENDVLHLRDKFEPLRSTYTDGDNNGVKPTLPIDELTDSGEASRDIADTYG